MQSGIIEDSQLASSGINRNNARLFNLQRGAYRYYPKELYLLIELKKPKVITAVAIQGNSFDYRFGVVKTYSLHVSNNKSNLVQVGVSFFLLSIYKYYVNTNCVIFASV